MGCWEVLGIKPTRDATAIREAYDQQAKFANAEEAGMLKRALSEAFAEAGLESDIPFEASDAAVPSAAVQPATDLSAADHQVVREVILQVKALLNDPARTGDVAVWKAVLTEPPADREALRQEISNHIEGQLRPMAVNGVLPTDVGYFLGHWFGWAELESASEGQESRVPGDPEVNEPEQLDPVSAAERESMKSFWPAVIGWIVGLVVLTSLFSNMTGQ
ncbi:hypothetical protein [Marinobacter mobilis]|uniref:Molecular chaperone DnaJ n=1 Tax=Marinobacter mobilis TaxID=488533 RepID=A0A1H3BJ43_9GAMM|nr:hypothetical protein [Marinobacter mobilis]SDX41334.1 hypothetical protein SAMN04487960_10930 [Marinobacter mobilis]